MVKPFHRKDGKYEFWAMEQPHWVDNKVVTRYHRTDGPARITKDKDGNTHYEWWQNGEPYRMDGPVKVTCLTDNTIIWYWPDGVQCANLWMQQHKVSFIDDYCTLPPEYALMYSLRYLH